MTVAPRNEAPSPDPLADEAARNTLALNPLVGLRSQDFVDAAQTLFKAFVTQPIVATEQLRRLIDELGQVVTGRSTRAPQAGDKRFADPAWTSSPLHRGLLQAYLAWGHALDDFVQRADLSERDKARARLITQILVDALAPTNALLGNPAALKRLVDSGGQSLWNGLQNYVADLVRNGGLPSQVETSSFAVGKNLATTPGAVVFRNEVFELIQYVPTTPEVWRRPLVVTPPQINKYYALDLSPEKSMVQFLLKSGVQTFCISWRNPTAEHRDWGLETYVAALDAAVDAARAIARADDVSLLGSCSGGITSGAYVSWLAGKNERKVKNLVLPVCMLDPAAMEDTTFGSLVTPETVLAAKQASRMRGVLDGQDLARMFAWMRPNDLIWNYWVNNYLLGNSPPAFDILFWNADTTRLPARLHSDFLDLISANPFVNPGALSIAGTVLDIRRAELDSYVIAGITDHITPWKSVYRTARILGESTTFVLSNAGHLQALLNPPGNPKASFVAGSATQADPDAFVTGGEKHTGSWWLHWRDWLSERSGEKVAAPSRLGNRHYPPGEPAPGTYVFQR